jgi:hypothetical protein
MGLALLLLIVQMACAIPSISSIGRVSAPTGAGPSSAMPAQGTQRVPVTGGQTVPADAQAMLQAVIGHYQAVGRDQALQDFTSQVPPFNGDSLFVLCIDSKHNISALGGQPLLVGISADALSDKNGQLFGQLLWQITAAEPKGSLPFEWKDPTTGQQESKILVYQKLASDVCGVVANQP